MITTIQTAKLNDDELVQRSLAGDRQASHCLIERHQALVCAVTYANCGDLQQSEDLAQETFLQAWKHLRDLKEPSRFRNWLCGIARNLARSARRQQARIPASPTPLDEDIRGTSAPTPPEVAITREEQALLWQTLERLPEEYREPLVLFYRHQESVAAVASALEISEDAARQRLHRGRAMLAERLESLVRQGLRTSGPTNAFTLSVLAAIPGLTTSTTSAALGVTAAKGAASAKGVCAVVAAVLLLAGGGVWVIGREPSQPVQATSTTAAATPASNADAIVRLLDDLVNRNERLTPEFIRLYFTYSMRAASPRYMAERQPEKQVIPIREHMDRLRHLQTLLRPEDLAQQAELRFELTRAQAIVDDTLNTPHADAMLAGAGDLTDVYEALWGTDGRYPTISAESMDLTCYISWAISQQDHDAEAHRQRLKSLWRDMSDGKPAGDQRLVLEQRMTEADPNKRPAECIAVATRELEMLLQRVRTTDRPSPVLIDMLCTCSLRLTGYAASGAPEKDAAFRAHVARMKDLATSMRQRQLELQALLADYSASLVQRAISAKP